MDIASMLEVEVNVLAEGKEDAPAPPRQQHHFPCQTFSKDEDDFYNLTYGSDVASVRFLRLHCTTCGEHIGSAPAESHNMHEHPILRVLLCAKCRDFYGEGLFDQGDDATDMFCRWCANGGNLYCCSHCSNTFCAKCIKRNFDPPTIKRIEDDESWKCFVCDPKDLYPLRSITRALLTHIETLKQILENEKEMNPKDVEEKMHMDETKCCSRKRKRRRRLTCSISEDDEEVDMNYTPKIERSDTPPAKKRKVNRNKNLVRNVFSNGHRDDHMYSSKSPRHVNDEPELDPADLMMSCEQTMIEGDTEIMNPHDNHDELDDPDQNTSVIPPSVSQRPTMNKIGPNNMAINPVPLANLLKVALSTGAKKIKVTHGPGNTKLVAVPVSMVPKAVAASSLSFVRPTTHFLVPKNTTNRPIQIARPVIRKTVVAPPSVINIDDDDEPVVVNSNNKAAKNTNNVGSNMHGEKIIDEINTDNMIGAMQVDSNGEDKLTIDERPISPARSASPSEQTTTTIDGIIPLKTQQRDQRFKRMLMLQTHEIDNTVGELKTKTLKLMQLSNVRSLPNEDPLASAAQSTKRFHRVLKKAITELSHINDRVVRDFVHWKKNYGKNAVAISKEDNVQKSENKEATTKENSSNKFKSKSDIPLEMTCTRESDTESDNESEDEANYGSHKIEANEVPADFSAILDHLCIFKRKPMCLKAVGDSSVLTEDKGCQADDVPWRDYEKCIGYSLLTRPVFDEKTQEVVEKPVKMSDDNFGKYQEQYLYHLQHIEDNGIETDDMKGLPDPNHIPLKDLIDSNSPFITDMLERLSPVALSNNIKSPVQLEPSLIEPVMSLSPDPMDISELPPVSDIDIANDIENENNVESVTNQEDENKPAEVSTSKAVEELVKMVTKLSEDLRNEQEAEKKQAEKVIDLEEETLMAVNSILDVVKGNSEMVQENDEEVSALSTVATNSEECIIME